MRCCWLILIIIVSVLVVFVRWLVCGFGWCLLIFVIRVWSWSLLLLICGWLSIVVFGWMCCCRFFRLMRLCVWLIVSCCVSLMFLVVWLFGCWLSVFRWVICWVILVVFWLMLRWCCRFSCLLRML